VEKEAEVSAGFWLGGTEVTVAAWKKFIAANPAFKTDAEKKGSALSVMADGSLGPTAGANWRTPVPGQVAGDLLPVTCVSPRDAAAFCVWLTKSEHDAHRLPAEFQFRLPTELEWEYACRGGEKNRSAFWWGDDPADGAGRINAAGDEFTKKHSATEPFNFSWSDPFVHAAPVNSSGEKGLNAFGLADMLGNVWECVSKPLLPKYPFAWRGGSFAEGPGIVRCASARHRYNDTPSANAGFRLCLARDPAP
jgi:formylglycine-generating enzyme required for sulfatase activity